jgi:hypothetical protein
MIAPLLRYPSNESIWPTDRCCHFCGLVIEPTDGSAVRGTFQPQRSRCWFEGAVEHDSLVSTAGLIGLPLYRCQVELADFLEIVSSTLIAPQPGVVELFAGKAKTPRRSAHRGRRESVAETHAPGDHLILRSLHESYGVVRLVASVMMGSMFGLAAGVIALLGKLNGSVASARPARSPCSSS